MSDNQCVDCAWCSKFEGGTWDCMRPPIEDYPFQDCADYADMRPVNSTCFEPRPRTDADSTCGVRCHLLYIVEQERDRARQKLALAERDRDLAQYDREGLLLLVDQLKKDIAKLELATKGGPDGQ